MADPMPPGGPLPRAPHVNDCQDPRPGPEARALVDALRRREGTDLASFEIWRRAAALAWEALNRVGRFYYAAPTGAAYFEPAGGALVEVNAAPDFSLLLWDGFGLNPAEAISRFVLEHLRMEACRAGTPAPGGTAGQPGEGAGQPPRSLPARDDPELISLSAAAELFGIAKSTLSKSARKRPGEPGFLRSVVEGRGRYFYKKDIESLARSRQRLRG